MSNVLEIKIIKHLGDDSYNNEFMILKPLTSITPWGTENFIWEGVYNEHKIVVNLPRNTNEEFADISKPSNLNISDQIINELKRVLKKLD